MQSDNVGSPFRRTAGDVAGSLPVTEERNKETNKEKLPSVHEMLGLKNGVANGRMKTCYDLSHNLVGFQAGDAGTTPIALLVCSMTHRPVEAAFAKERPASGSRDGFEKDLDCETSKTECGFKWRPPSGTRLFSRITSSAN